MAAVRVVLEYDGDEVRLVSTQRVDMVVPPADAPADDEVPLGLWAEVRRADGTPLYRRSLGHQVRTDIEVFPQDAAQSIIRAPVDRPSGMVVLVLPDGDDVDHVALVDNAPEPGPPGAPGTAGATPRLRSREVLRIPLRPGGEAGSP